MQYDDFIAKFSELTSHMLQTMEKKNKDYSRGADPLRNFRRHGSYGIVVRMDDKISRLDSLLNKKYSDNVPAIKDEKIEDTALDLANYALLLIITHMDEQEKEQNANKAADRSDKESRKITRFDGHTGNSDKGSQ